MNDRAYEALQRRANRFVRRWRSRLWLNDWQVDTTFYREGDGNGSARDGFERIAWCHADWRYKLATVSINCPTFAATDAAEQEKTILHELLHAVVHEMREWAPDGGGPTGAIDHEERVVTVLTDILWMAYKE